MSKSATRMFYSPADSYSKSSGYCSGGFSTANFVFLRNGIFFHSIIMIWPKDFSVLLRLSDVLVFHKGRETLLFLHTSSPSVFLAYFLSLWRRQWHPTLVLLPGESHGWKSLVGYSPRVAKSQTWLSDFTFAFRNLHFLQVAQVVSKEMVLASHFENPSPYCVLALTHVLWEGLQDIQDQSLLVPQQTGNARGLSW